jgi:hypothetical protein
MVPGQTYAMRKILRYASAGAVHHVPLAVAPATAQWIKEAAMVQRTSVVAAFCNGVLDQLPHLSHTEG